MIYIYIYIYMYTYTYVGNNHHPTWRSHMFQRGGYTTNQWRRLEISTSLVTQSLSSFMHSSLVTVSLAPKLSLGSVSMLVWNMFDEQSPSIFQPQWMRKDHVLHMKKIQKVRVYWPPVFWFIAVAISRWAV